MTGKKKLHAGGPKVGNLKLNKETVQDLTDTQAEEAEGGQVFHPLSPRPCLKHENLHEANDNRG